MPQDWRKRKELLLGITYPEDRSKRWALKMAIQRKEEEMAREEAHMKAVGTCPQCHIVRTAEGNCTMGCS